MKWLYPSFLSNSLRIRFIVIVVGLLLGVVVAFSVVIVSNSISTQRKTLVEQALSFAKLSKQPLGDTYQLYFNSGRLKFKELASQVTSLDADVKRIQIIEPEGVVLFDSDFLNVINTEADVSSFGKVDEAQVLEAVRS